MKEETLLIQIYLFEPIITAQWTLLWPCTTICRSRHSSIETPIETKYDLPYFDRNCCSNKFHFENKKIYQLI